MGDKNSGDTNDGHASDSDEEEKPKHKSGIIIAVGVSVIIGIVIALLYYYGVYLPNQTEQSLALAAAALAQQQAAAAQTAALLAAQRSAEAQQASIPAVVKPPVNTTALTVQDTLNQGTQQAARDSAAVAQEAVQTSAQVAAQLAAQQQTMAQTAQLAIRASIEAALKSTQAAQTATQYSIDAIHAAYAALTEQLSTAYQYVGGCTYAVYSNVTASTPTATLTMIYTLLKPDQQASATNAGMQNPLMANLITQYNTIDAAIEQMETTAGQIAGYATSLKTETNEDEAHLDSTAAQSAAASCAAMLDSTNKQINVIIQLIGPATQAAVLVVQTNAATTLNVTQDNTTAAVQAAQAQSELLTKQQKAIAASNTAAINAANAAANATALAAAESIARIAAQNASEALAIAQATAAAEAAAIATAIQTIQLAQTGINTALNSATTQAAVAQTAIQGSAIYLGACGMPSMTQFPFSITNAISLVANNTTSTLLNAYNNFTLNQQTQIKAAGTAHPYIIQITEALAPVQTQMATLQSTSALLSGYLATAKNEQVKVQAAQNAANLATQAAATSAAASAAIIAALNIVNTGLQNNIPVLATNIQKVLNTYSGPFQVLYYADDYLYIYQNGFLMGNNSNKPGCAGVLAYNLDRVTTGDVITFMVQNVGGGAGLAAQWQWGPDWRGGLPNTSPIVSKTNLYIASPAIFSGSSGSTTKWVLNQTAMQAGMPPTTYNPGITAPENLSTLAANFTPTTPMLITDMPQWGMCTGPAVQYTPTLTSGGQVSEQSRCPYCYIAFNWNVPLITRDPSEPFSKTIENTNAYIATLNAPLPSADSSVVTAPFSGTFGADNFLFLYRNGQLVYNNDNDQGYHAIAGAAKSGDIFDFVVQNTGGYGCLIGRLSWNGTTYYTGGAGSRSDLFANPMHTGTVTGSYTTRMWPPYEQLVNAWKTSPGPIGLYHNRGWPGWTAFSAPFPGSHPIFDSQQNANSYVMFRWTVPKVKPTPYKQIAGSFWLSAPSGTYTCPNATGVTKTTAHKGYCSFTGADAQANVEAWCDSDPACTGYVYGEETGYRYMASKVEPTVNGMFPPNQYFKKQQTSSFTSRGYYNRAVRL